MSGEHKVIHSGGVGIKGGIVNASSLTVNGNDYDLSFAPSGSIFLWFRLPSYWVFSSTIDLTNYKVINVHEWFLDLSFGLKKMYRIPRKRMALLPGFAVGYGYWPDVGLIGPSTYLTLKGGVDLIFVSSGKIAYLLESSVMIAPSGGPKDASAHFNPSINLRFGLIF